MEYNTNNLFFPSIEIKEPKWFSGRKDPIERAVKALTDEGASIIVYGERGVGKSSFVEMIKRIVEGDHTLIFRNNLHKKYSVKNLKFQVVELDCDEDTDSTSKVLQSLITSRRGIRKILKNRIEKLESTKKNGLSILPTIFNFNFADEDKTTYTWLNEQSIFETFRNIIYEIESDFLEEDEGLLIVLDEFDRVQNTSKMGSLIKNLSSRKVKFLISGIASNYTELLKDHHSTHRQLLNGRIEILPMNKNEVNELFDIVELNSDGKINFNESLREEVYNLSQGYPYFVQMCGQMSLNNFANTNPTFRGSVNTTHLKKGLEFLLEYEPLLDELYLDVIGDNKEKEIILRGIANMVPKKVLRRSIMDFGANQKIRDSKIVLSKLLAYRFINYNGKESKILEVLGNDYVYFSDTLFKIFCRVRDPLIN